MAYKRRTPKASECLIPMNVVIFEKTEQQIEETKQKIEKLKQSNVKTESKNDE